MGRLEKYGVCALLFVIVTVLAVSIWGPRPGKSTASPAGLAAARPNPAGVPTPASGARPLPDPAKMTDSIASPAAPSGGLPSPAPLLPAPNAAKPATPFDEAPVPVPGLKSTPAVAVPAVASALGALGGRSVLYQVKKGDTLDVIARHTLGSSARWGEILKWNEGLDPKRLRVGQTVVIPPSSESRVVEAAPPVPAPSAKPSTTGLSAPAKAAASQDRNHRVARGDTLYRIAQRYYGDGERYRDIFAANRKVLSDADDLAVGTVLVIP